jgi:hypothetical protein
MYKDVIINISDKTGTIVYGVLNLKNQEKVPLAVHNVLGSGLYWRYLGLIKDGTYKDQYALTPMTSFDLGFEWIPECLIEVIDKYADTLTNVLIKEGRRGEIKMEIKDSGEKRTFETGSVRDKRDGKGRCDLLPACALLRVAKHYEAGGKKYGDRNWEKGQPIGDLLDSGIRHLLNYMDGQADEDHLAAAAWNILGAIWMEEKKPEMQNIPSRVAEKSPDFDYDILGAIEERKIAKWEVWKISDGDHNTHEEGAKCSICGYTYYIASGSLEKLSTYCPGCNSRMSL